MAIRNSGHLPPQCRKAVWFRPPQGGSGSARVTVDIQPTDAPLAAITAPTTSGIYYADQLTTLEGQVSDADDEASGLAVVWESTVDGVLVGGFDTPDSEGERLSRPPVVWQWGAHASWSSPIRPRPSGRSSS